MTTKPKDIISAAMNLPPGKQVILRFQDRKRFLSMKAGLYAAKRNIEDDTVQIKTVGYDTIILRLIDEADKIDLVIEDIPENEELEVQNSPSTRATKTSQNAEAGRVLTDLYNKQQSLLEEMKVVVSLLGTEQTLLDQTDPESALYKLQTTYNTISKMISDTKSYYGISPDRFPTNELPNEEELIEE